MRKTISEKSPQFWDFAEQNELLSWRAIYQDCPKGECGIDSLDFDSVFCGAMSRIDILAFNRAIGLGLKTPISENALRQIVEFFRNAGVNRFFLPLSPMYLSSDARSTLKRSGFFLYNHWVKLYRRVDKPVAPPDSRLVVRKINPDEGSLYGKIIVEAFDWPVSLQPVFARTVGKEGFAHYFAELDGKPVAASALYINNAYASMAIAGTLAPYRGLGAQSAMLATRIKTAFDAGCRFILTETARENPDKPVPSYRNMIRFGFRTAYLRPNYIYYFNGLT